MGGQTLWQILRDLRAMGDMSWLVMRDLNEILYSFEKEGGRTRSKCFMQAFRDALEDCQLVDCGFMDDKFTWHRGNIRERLGRALANDAWNNLFNGETMHHLNY